MFSQPGAGHAPAPEPEAEKEAEPVSHNTSIREPELDEGLDEGLNELWETASRALGMEREQSTAPNSPAESSKGAWKKAHGADGAA